MDIVMELTYLALSISLVVAVLAGVLIFIVIAQIVMFYSEKSPISVKEIENLNAYQKQAIWDYIEEFKEPFTRKMYTAFFGNFKVEKNNTVPKKAKVIEKQQAACKSNII